MSDPVAEAAADTDSARSLVEHRHPDRAERRRAARTDARGTECGTETPAGIPATLANGKKITLAWETSTARQLLDTEYSNQFLIRGIWHADAYGTISAGPKAQKTWDCLDLAVGVAAGTNWLGRFQIDRQGPVVFYSGEGGDRNMTRRLTAVFNGKGIDPNGPVAEHVHFHTRAPRLTDQQHLDTIRYNAETIRPALIILDPLYLSIGDEMKALAKVGELLAQLQHIAEDVGAALIIAHHWNKTGHGKGHDRASGTGVHEWARVLMSVSVDHQTSDPLYPKSSFVARTFRISGNEISELEFSATRKIWTDDPEDPESDMHYEVVTGACQGTPADRDTGERDRAGNRPATAAGRSLAFLDLEPDRWFSAREVQSTVGDDMKAQGGKPVSAETVLTALKNLAAKNHIHQQGSKGGQSGGGYEFRVGANAHDLGDRNESIR